MRSNRIRTTLSSIWLVFTLSLVSWWFIFAMSSLNPSENSEVDKHYKMLFYEGSTLLVTVLIGGIVMIFFSYKDEQRHKKLKIFFSNFTHDIKTAIARIRLQADVLSEADDVKDNKVLSRLLKDISKLDLKLENSLFLSHTHETDLFIEKIKLEDLFVSLRFEFEDIQLNLHKKAIIEADSRAIRSVFRNIIENSRQHGKASILNINCLAMNNQNIKLEIEDNGHGSSRNSESLGNDLLISSDNQGNGIGLYLVKQLIIKMRGQIRFKTQINNGFKVVIILKGSIVE